MNAILYARVSTDDQSERGTIEGQLEFGEKYADLHQMNLLKVYKDDGISGTLELKDRIGGSELLDDIQSKKIQADVMLIYKLDRLGRSARVILNAIHELDQYGVKVKSMTEDFDSKSPSGRLLVTMLAAIADFERENIIERMWHGANRAARKGKWLGGIVPYGYYVDDEGYLEINRTPIPNLGKSEADIIHMMYHLIGEKHYSAWEVAKLLNSMGVPTAYVKDHRKVKRGKRKVKTSGKWRPSRVRAIIYNTTYKGIHQYGKRANRDREIIEREVPAIVTPELWEKAVNAIKNPNLASIESRVENNLLRGLIKCGLCGRNYYAVYYNGAQKKKKYYFVCAGKVGDKALYNRCTSKNVPKDWLEELVWNDIVNFASKPESVIQEIVNDLNNEKEKQVENDLSLEIEFLEKAIKAKDNEKQSILDLFRKNLITSEDVELQLNKINDEKQELLARLDRLRTEADQNQEAKKRLSSAEKILKELKERIKGDLSNKEKKEIIQTIVKDIVVHTIKTPGKHRDKANVQINYVFSIGQDYTD
ncbi:recombinase family protein, partial [Caldalkalibacillus thermarum]|uniref:recombinase family protein n=1 Tax=Caldalkalibacillus thermarum TaxID=296745 RepID=UPI00166A53D5